MTTIGIKMRRTIIRSSRRLLSAVAASPTTAPPVKPAERGRLLPTTAALSTAAVAGAGAVYLLSRTFVEDASFREKLRSERSTVASWIEDEVLAKYAPAAWAQSVRIHDELGSEAEQGVHQLHMPNVGVLQPPPSELSTMGQLFYGRFAGLDLMEIYTRSGAFKSTAEGSSMHIAGIDLGVTPIAGNPNFAAMAPDDDDAAAEPPGSLAASMTRFVEDEPALGPYLTDGADGARYSAGAEASRYAAWTMAKPPALPTRQLVPDKAGRRFEDLLQQYARDAALDVGSLPATSARSGWRLISLPEVLRDESHLTNRDESHLEASGLSHVPARRLQWLRLYEAYLEAEEQALDAHLGAMTRLATQSEGGGVGLMRMQARKRVLHQALIELEYEQREWSRR